MWLRLDEYPTLSIGRFAIARTGNSDPSERWCASARYWRAGKMWARAAWGSNPVSAVFRYIRGTKAK